MYTIKDKNQILEQIMKNQNMQEFLECAFFQAVFSNGGISRFQEILKSQNFNCDFELSQKLFDIVKLVIRKRFEK